MRNTLKKHQKRVSRAAKNQKWKRSPKNTRKKKVCRTYKILNGGWKLKRTEKDKKKSENTKKL